jgi:hypothetical protein
VFGPQGGDKLGDLGLGAGGATRLDARLRRFLCGRIPGELLPAAQAGEGLANHRARGA